MNKRNRIYVSTLAALFFVACSNNDEAVIEPSPTQQGQVTFAFSKTTGVTTYADPIANEAESQLDVEKMKIYMVDDASEMVETIFEGTNIVKGSSGTNATATISLPNASIGAKTFYFVGNTETVGDMIADNNIVAGTTTLDELIEMATDKQDVEIPLSAIRGLLLTGKTTPITLGTASINQSVTLKRRVARFDVNNDAITSKATILGILVSDANLSGYVFADNDPAIQPTVETGTLKEIAFEGLTNANVGLTPSVFYLYPAAKADAFTIQLRATVNGTERLFTVAIPADGIEANKRYTITAKDDANMEFALVIADWDEGVGVEGEVISGVTLVSDKAEIGDGWDQKLLTANARIGNAIDLVLSTQRSAGMTVEIDGNDLGIDVKVDPDYVFTYAAEYQWKARLTIPKYMEDAAMKIKIRFLDKIVPESPHVEIIVSAEANSIIVPDPIPNLVWAGSNIYWDGRKLTFDDAGETSNKYYQGVYFKFGSLIGINAFSTNFSPQGTTYDFTRSGTESWNSISVDTKDICKQLKDRNLAPAGKDWRLPTSAEFAAIANYDSEGTFESISPTNNDGRMKVNRGYSSVAPDVFFPAAGYRVHEKGSPTGALTDLGTGGRYWSSDGKDKDNNALCMAFTSFGEPENLSAPKQDAYSVRCVATVTP